MQDSIFTVHSVEIPFDYNETFSIFTPSDIHRFAPLCYEESWFDFLNTAKKTKNAYFLGLGDYDDLASTSERFILDNKQLHESTRIGLDEYARTRTLKLCEEMKFMKGKVIGLIEGNHHYVTASGVTTTQIMCEELNCKYLGAASFIRIKFKYKHGSRGTHLDLFAHHGASAARSIGASMNAVQKMSEIAVADIYVSGHDHKKSVGTQDRLVLIDSSHGLRSKNKTVYYIKSGSFLAGYRDNKPGYVVKKALPPTNLGTARIDITPRIKDLKGETIETNLEIRVSI